MNNAEIRVLVVDDQELFRAGIQGMINAQPDLEVVGQAADGVEALQQVDALNPDIVLLDMRMPEMDGVATTKEIFNPVRMAKRSRPLRVIVLTTFDLDDQAANAIRYGASGYLLKDCTPQMLTDAIRTVHRGGAVLSPTELTSLLRMTAPQPPAPPSEFLELSEREREVLQAVAEGLTNAEIADRIFAAESTIKSHVGSILRKLGLRDRVQIAVYAHTHSLIPK